MSDVAKQLSSDDPATIGWLKHYLALVTVGMAVKKALVEAGEEVGSCECPRCTGKVHVAIVGRKAHLRMACVCGLSVME